MPVPASPRPPDGESSVDAYVQAAPPEGQPHLRELRALLRGVAPEADEVIKWGVPFFVEPRFLYSFSVIAAHLAFVPSAETLDAFRAEAGPYATTKNVRKVRYDQPLPADLIRRMAEHRLQVVAQRDDASFW